MGTGDFTVECWVYVVSDALAEGAYGQRVFDSNTGQLGIYINSDGTGGYVGALVSGTDIRSTVVHGIAPEGTWTPAAICRSGDDFRIFPVDGYGNHEIIRSIMQKEKPDALWFMTDPRFYGWLWEMEHEIRAHVPMIYYHVWDNSPFPTYNQAFYESNDFIACISKVTHDIVTTVAPEVNSAYIPHAVDSEFFKPFESQLMVRLKN